MECHKKGTKDIVDRLKGAKKYLNAMMSGRALFSSCALSFEWLGAWAPFLQGANGYSSSSPCWQSAPKCICHHALIMV